MDNANSGYDAKMKAPKVKAVEAAPKQSLKLKKTDDDVEGKFHEILKKNFGPLIGQK